MGDRRWETEDGRQEIGDRRLETEDWRQEARDERKEKGDGGQETRDGRQEMGDKGDGRQKTGTGDEIHETGRETVDRTVVPNVVDLK